jgi:hypothetical protein
VTHCSMTSTDHGITVSTDRRFGEAPRRGLPEPDVADPEVPELGGLGVATEVVDIETAHLTASQPPRRTRP